MATGLVTLSQLRWLAGWLAGWYTRRVMHPSGAAARTRPWDTTPLGSARWIMLPPVVLTPSGIAIHEVSAGW